MPRANPGWSSQACRIVRSSGDGFNILKQYMQCKPQSKIGYDTDNGSCDGRKSAFQSFGILQPLNPRSERENP